MDCANSGQKKLPHGRKDTQHRIGPDIDAAAHFNPRYKPWNQRHCMSPDGDIFAALKKGNASIVTDEIDQLTDTGLTTRSGCEIEADLSSLPTA